MIRRKYIGKVFVLENCHCFDNDLDEWVSHPIMTVKVLGCNGYGCYICEVKNDNRYNDNFVIIPKSAIYGLDVLLENENKERGSEYGQTTSTGMVKAVSYQPLSQSER